MNDASQASDVFVPPQDLIEVCEDLKKRLKPSPAAPITDETLTNIEKQYVHSIPDTLKYFFKECGTLSWEVHSFVHPAQPMVGKFIKRESLSAHLFPLRAVNDSLGYWCYNSQEARVEMVGHKGCPSTEKIPNLQLVAFLQGYLFEIGELQSAVK